MTRIPATLLAVAMVTSASLASAQAPAPSTDTGWKTIVYPVRGWIPRFDANVNLPEGPSDGQPSEARAKVSSSFNGAFAAGFRVERWRISVDGSFLWAGMSGEVSSPFARVDVDTISGKVFGGFRVLPSLFVDAGVRRLALDIDASIFEARSGSWKPGFWQPSVGLTWRPQFGSALRLLAQGNTGGTDRHRASEVTATLEWKPFSHFSIGAGYGYMRVHVDGELRNRRVNLRQTLKGPTLAVGVPF